MELNGRTAVVTGAASGIGLALTDALLGEGVAVVMADIEEPVLMSQVDRLKGEGAKVLGVAADVASLDDMLTLAGEAERAFGPVFLLVNNAGVGTVGPPVWRLTDADWRWVLEVNLFGTINGLLAFLPGMVERGEGHIVNTASAAGLVSPSGMAPYVVSKHAIVSLSEAVQHDLDAAGVDIGVTVVCPGLVATNMASTERNRQPTYQLDALAADERSADFSATVEGMRRATEAGRDPADLATIVVEAVKEGRFLVIPDDWVLEAFRARAADILELRAPADPS